MQLMDKFPYKNGKNLHSTELCLGKNARQGMEESLDQDAGLIRGCLSVEILILGGVNPDF
jgi:hypothetical protein